MPLLWLSAAFIAGILLGKAFPLHWWAWGGGAGFFLLLSIFVPLLQKRVSSLKRIHEFTRVAPGLIALFLCLGALRYLAGIPPLNSSRLAWYNDRGEYTLVGTISAPPDVRQGDIRYQITFSELTDSHATDLSASVHPITGAALVTLPRWNQWQIGDQLLFTGSPLTPAVFPDFSYKEYLARQGVQSVIYYPQGVQKVGEKSGTGFRRWLVAFRENARLEILSLMPQPESGLLEGILLGLENDIPPSLLSAYRDTGTSHIIAISGFNMTLIATLLIVNLSRAFRRIWGILAAIVIIAIYTLFVDGGASVVRAAIMASTAAIAHLVGRRQSGYNALFFTAAVLCVFNPLVLWDVSFQLSFAAVLGLVLFGAPMQNRFTELISKWLGEKRAACLTSPVSEYFLFTLAAQVTTLPVIALQFKRISMVSLLANPLILPVQPVILQAGLVTTIGGFIHPVLGKLCAMFTWPLLAYTNLIVSSLAKIKGAAVTLHPTAAIWILLAVMLVLLAFLLRNFFKKQFGNAITVWIIAFLIAGGFSAWSIYAHRPDRNLSVRLVKTGDASMLFMRTPAGRNLLFDLSGDVRETSAALTPLLSPWDYHLDALVLTHSINDIALSDLDQMLKVDSVITSNTVLRPSVDSYPLALPEDTSLSTLPVSEAVELEPDLTLTVMAEGSGAAAYAIHYGQVTLLIPAGVDYALLKEKSPDLMDSPEALVLTPDDVSYIPPRLWAELEPKVILWNGLESSPFAGSMTPVTGNRASLVTDGNQIWSDSD